MCPHIGSQPSGSRTTTRERQALARVPRNVRDRERLARPVQAAPHMSRAGRQVDDDNLVRPALAVVAALICVVDGESELGAIGGEGQAAPGAPKSGSDVDD